MEGQIHGALYQLPATFSVANSRISLTRKESLKVYASGGETWAKDGLLMASYISI